MKYPYQIFGSKSSLDLDVCFFVKELSNIEDNHKKVKTCIEKSAFKTLKKVNANLAIIKEGVVIDCFKGVADELNNALFTTYSLHNQDFNNHIKRLLERKLDLRIKRCSRSLVSYFTRTRLRKEAKKALAGTLLSQLEFLEQLKLEEFIEFGKHGSIIEVYKSMAFQLGMTLALFQGIELYTKESVIELFPEFKLYLLRFNNSSESLEKHIKLFIKETRLRIK